ncbi:hypothetical protein [Tateyamaria sp.]|uniref:hypothetical protein n=1 Tax=Tateyamaria sp. TaxID=1929288 RepID=UPI00329FD4AA
MKVYSPLYDGNISLFSVLTVGASATASILHKLEPEKTIDPKIYAGAFYQPWPGKADEEALWSETYPTLTPKRTMQWEDIRESLRLHCLPLCFERGRFVIPKALPPWTLDPMGMANVELLIQNFGGWSICMAREELSAWQPYLEGKGVYPDQLRIGSDPSGNGRPEKQSEALRDYQTIFPEKHNGTLKEALQQIEISTGNSYSESTLRRALRSTQKTDQS